MNNHPIFKTPKAAWDHQKLNPDVDWACVRSVVGGWQPVERTHIVFMKHRGYIEFLTSDGRSGSNPSIASAYRQVADEIILSIGLVEYTEEWL